MKKTISIFLSMIMVILSMSMTVPAAENEIGYGDPIFETSYYDDNGAYVTERIFFKADRGTKQSAVTSDSKGITLRADSGAGWYKNEKSFAWDNGLSRPTIYYAQGYFVWGGGDISVSSASGSWDYKPSNATISNEELEYGNGRYALIFNKYAYVTYSFTITNVIGIKSNCSATIRISESGNNI